MRNTLHETASFNPWRPPTSASFPRSGFTGATSRDMSVNISEAPRRDVIEIISPPPRRPRVNLPRLFWCTATRAAEALGRRLQRLVRRRAKAHRRSGTSKLDDFAPPHPFAARGDHQRAIRALGLREESSIGSPHRTLAHGREGADRRGMVGHQDQRSIARRVACQPLDVATNGCDLGRGNLKSDIASSGSWRPTDRRIRREAPPPPCSVARQRPPPEA
jgi:hypothetical protein